MAGCAEVAAAATVSWAVLAAARLAEAATEGTATAASSSAGTATSPVARQRTVTGGWCLIYDLAVKSPQKMPLIGLPGSKISRMPLDGSQAGVLPSVKRHI